MLLENLLNEPDGISVVRDGTVLRHEDLQAMRLCDLPQCKVIIKGNQCSIRREPGSPRLYEGKPAKTSTLIAFNFQGLTVKEIDTNPVLPFLHTAYEVTTFYYKP